MNRTLAAALTAYAFFFMSGFFINIGGPVSSAAAVAFGTDTAALGLCFSLFMIGRLIGILGNGALVRRNGLNRNAHIRSLSVLPLAATAGLLLATRSAGAFAAWIFLAGIGIGGMYSASNMILVDIFEGKRRAFHLSMINFFYSLGAVMSPALSGFMLDGGSPWSAPYLSFAVILLAWVAVTARSSFSGLFASHGESPSSQAGGNSPLSRLAGGDSPGQAVADAAAGPERVTVPLVLVCAAIVLVIFAEYTVTYWTPIYLREFRREDALFSGLAVSVFWVAVLLGRFAESMLIARIRPRLYLLASGVTATAALSVLPFLSSRAAIITGIFVSGALCAGLFPALFTFGAARAERLKRTFPTLMMLSAATGSFLAMPAGSLVKRAFGMRGVMFAAPAAVILASALVFLSDARAQKRSGAAGQGTVH